MLDYKSICYSTPLELIYCLVQQHFTLINAIYQESHSFSFAEFQLFFEDLEHYSCEKIRNQ